jgi:DNA-binding NtrC family response regulator
MSRILIVEDEPNVRLVFRAALASNEYTVSTTADGETALRWLKREPADLVLLDLQMPGLGGMETLKRLREDGIDTPVVIVSAHDSIANVVQAMRLGAVDFLSKPTTPGSLRAMVADVLARRASATATATAARAPGPEKATLKAEAPTSPQAEALAKAKQALNRRAFEEAEDALVHVNTLGRSAEAYYLLGVLHETRDDRQAAYNAYRSALQADPGYEPARLHLMKYFGDRIM